MQSRTVEQIKEIADKYNVSFSCIEAIANKRHWKGV